MGVPRKRRLDRAKAYAAYRERRKQAGVCGLNGCWRKVHTGAYYCDKDAALHAERMREWRRNRKESRK